MESKPLVLANADSTTAAKTATHGAVPDRIDAAVHPNIVCSSK